MSKKPWETPIEERDDEKVEEVEELDELQKDYEADTDESDASAGEKADLEEADVADEDDDIVIGRHRSASGRSADRSRGSFVSTPVLTI
ncbi:MAG: LysM domain-containing protein, partial [Streptococcus sobrinus]